MLILNFLDVLEITNLHYSYDMVYGKTGDIFLFPT